MKMDYPGSFQMLLPPTSSPLTNSRQAPHRDRVGGTMLNSRKGDAARELGGHPGGSKDVLSY